MKLHLGCGPNYQQGWLNLDIDSPCADMLHDLRLPLPFASGSVDYIYNEHFIEHITLEHSLIFLKECRRVLKNGGVFRTSTPDLRWLIAQYISGSVEEWRDVNWTPSSSCQLVNEGMRSWGHQFLYDRDELFAVLRAAGFHSVAEADWCESKHAELCNMESRPYHHELIVEAS